MRICREYGVRRKGKEYLYTGETSQVLPQPGDQGQHRRWSVMFVVCTLDMRASQVALAVKNLAANAGDIRDASSILGSERSSGGGHGSPLQYSCLENPTDKGVWWAIVHGVAENQTQLKRLSTHTLDMMWWEEPFTSAVFLPKAHHPMWKMSRQ